LRYMDDNNQNTIRKTSITNQHCEQKLSAYIYI
jgi:hypothetical protein